MGMLFLKVEERNLLEERVRAGKQITAALERFVQEEKPASLAVPLMGKTRLQICSGS